MKKQQTTNKVLAKAGLNSLNWKDVQNSTSVPQLNFCARNPRLLQAYLIVEFM